MAYNEPYEWVKRFNGHSGNAMAPRRSFRGRRFRNSGDTVLNRGRGARCVRKCEYGVHRTLMGKSGFIYITLVLALLWRHNRNIIL